MKRRSSKWSESYRPRESHESGCAHPLVTPAVPPGGTPCSSRRDPRNNASAARPARGGWVGQDRSPQAPRPNRQMAPEVIRLKRPDGDDGRRLLLRAGDRSATGRPTVSPGAPGRRAPRPARPTRAASARPERIRAPRQPVTDLYRSSGRQRPAPGPAPGARAREGLVPDFPWRVVR
jgi:hypothetical protein